MEVSTGIIELCEWKDGVLDLGFGIKANVVRFIWWGKRQYSLHVVGVHYGNYLTKKEAQDTGECVLRQILTYTNMRLNMMEAITPPSDAEDKQTTLARIEYEQFLREMAITDRGLRVK